MIRVFIIFYIALFSCQIVGFAEEVKPRFKVENKTVKIAFGSCGHQDSPLKIFKHVLKQKPDLFVFLGDNIYGDTTDMSLLRKKYDKLGANTHFKAMKAEVPILATWDDHDYGRNDAGKNYPKKVESKAEFLRFFEEPEDSSRRLHEGIYHAEYIQAGDKLIQVLLLDERTFRDDLVRRSNQSGKSRRYFYHLDYMPHTDPKTTILGAKQWQWLEAQLKRPADLRIIASGTQFGIEYNGYEAWANFPHERTRLLELIKSTQANHVMVISGDVHYAEISKFEQSGCYPIYDVTASGLSRDWHFATPNKNRIEGPIMDNHFGLLTVDLSTSEKASVRAEIWDHRDNQRVEYTIPLKEIRFAK